MALISNPPANTKLRASVYGGQMDERKPIDATKAGDTSRTNQTLTADADLVLALPVGTWVVEVNLLMLSAANAAGDFQCQVSYPADATVSDLPLGLVDSLASGSSADLQAVSGSVDATTPTTARIFGCSTTGTGVRMWLRVVMVTAGNLTLVWAQQTTNASATTLRAGSSMTARRVA